MRRTIFAIFLLGVVALTTGCANQEHEAIKQAVLERVTDSDAAQIKKITVFRNAGDAQACITFNMKNRQSGYNETIQLHAVRFGDKWTLMTGMDLMTDRLFARVTRNTHEGCVAYLKRAVGK